MVELQHKAEFLLQALLIPVVVGAVVLMAQTAMQVAHMVRHQVDLES
jgi:hypothetical protein